ncbi:MAG TPA: FtsX-like permease family protein [Syntrophomonas sp.]|nr:FtsX-like permease family protein [Syntrophomonas sp.]
MMVISCILIALAAISLAASSLMIYMSVGERTKEIGILRSIGASRKDIARVFSAATLMVGFAAGAIGIGVSWLLTVPLNAMIKAGTGISGMAALSVVEAILLVLISMGLHCIAGLIASGIAVKQDPVAALISK